LYKVTAIINFKRGSLALMSSDETVQGGIQRNLDLVVLGWDGKQLPLEQGQY
jgi:hypothetical protein